MEKVKIAIVTGGANNIGYSCVQKLTGDYHVVIADINEPEELVLQEGQTFLQCDITDERSCQELFAQASRIGEIKVVVNSAGITAPPRSIEETPLDEWKRIINVNLDGAFTLAKSAIPYLKKSEGSMVLITSRAGRTGFAALGTNATVTKAHYCASKAGVISLVKSLALELAPFNIRVNAVAPGPIEGTMIPKEKWPEICKKVPLARLGKTKDIAAGVVFLCSDEADFITGHTLDVNGGTLMS